MGIRLLPRRSTPGSAGLPTSGADRVLADHRMLPGVSMKDDLGRLGEQLAADHLTRLGWRILDRNWRCPVGEIDIVALDDGELVVVEVKTRRSRAFGDPLEGVTDAKLTRLCVLAGAWRRAHPAVRFASSRIDLVGVLVPGRAPVSVDHLRGAA